MKETSRYYTQTPIGEQLLAHFKNRAKLRRSAPLFPLSLNPFSRSTEKKSVTKTVAPKQKHHRDPVSQAG